MQLRRSLDLDTQRKPLTSQLSRCLYQDNLHGADYSAKEQRTTDSRAETKPTVLRRPLSEDIRAFASAGTSAANARSAMIYSATLQSTWVLDNAADPLEVVVSGLACSHV